MMAKKNCLMATAPRRRFGVLALTLAATFMAFTDRSFEVVAQERHPTSADVARAEAETAARTGEFSIAAKKWSVAARLYSEAGEGAAQGYALVKLAEAQQAAGEYKPARQSLMLARQIVEKTGDRVRLASILGTLGNVQSTLSRAEADQAVRAALAAEADRNLREGLALANEASALALAASILTDIGNHLAVSGRSDDAIAAYSLSAETAERASEPSVGARALANEARVAHLAGRPELSESSLQSASRLAAALPASHDKAFTLTSIGQSYAALVLRQPARQASLLASAEQSFDEAIAAAQRVDDMLALSYAGGYRGALYEQLNRYDEALELTRRALFAAMQAQDRSGHLSGAMADTSAIGVNGAAGDSLYRWHYQMGRIFEAQRRLPEAIDAGRRAVEVLQGIRFEMTTTYGQTQASFRETVEPVYHFLVRLLLDQSQQAAQRGDEQRRRSLLVEARDRVENLKVAELRNYFQDDCVEGFLAAQRDAGQVDDAAAVIYPILLESRTDILLNLPDGRLEQVTMNVGREEITASVNRFRSCIGDVTCFSFFEDGERLYNWLIRPLEKSLQASSVDTLVFVPDGALRTVPMAALFDGKNYLIQRYAVAIIPALNLIDPQQLRSDRSLRVLRTGLSEAVAGFVALPQVRLELEGIGDLYPEGNLLLNDDFTPDRLNALLANNSYSVVHIASHGEFRREASEAYLQTSAGRLPMNDLAAYIGQLRFRGLPTGGSSANTSALELLVLSACETAEGDERAALGLAGLAIKAGARSALGTLWSVNDEAAGELVVEFYRQLRNRLDISKAEALRQAQITILGGRFEHPQFWAAFLLISNWL
jgi:CHAT domain-containing protein